MLTVVACVVVVVVVVYAVSLTVLFLFLLILLPKFRTVSVADNFLAGVLVGAEEEVEKEQGHHIVIPTTHPILSPLDQHPDQHPPFLTLQITQNPSLLSSSLSSLKTLRTTSNWRSSLVS